MYQVYCYKISSLLQSIWCIVTSNVVYHCIKVAGRPPYKLLQLIIILNQIIMHF